MKLVAPAPFSRALHKLLSDEIPLPPASLKLTVEAANALRRVEPQQN